MNEKRNSNIELLRILAMLMIIAGHFAGQGGLKDYSEGISRLFIYWGGSGQRVAINIFLIISVWFLVDQEFSAKRIIKIWLEVIFYTGILTLTVKVFGGVVGVKELIQSFLPFLGRPLWFASAYLALLMLSPFLKKTVELPRKQHGCLVINLGLITFVLPTIASEMDTYLCAVIWFCFVYILIGYYKHYIHPIKINGWVLLIGGMLLYSVMAVFLALTYESELFTMIQCLCERFLHDFKSIPNFLIAFSIFIGFIKMKPQFYKVINEIASGAFAVYIIHQTPVFYPLLWGALTSTGLFVDTKMIPMFVLAVILLYLMFSTIDIIRRKLLEPKVMNTKIFDKACIAIQRFYGLKVE